MVLILIAIFSWLCAPVYESFLLKYTYGEPPGAKLFTLCRSPISMHIRLTEQGGRLGPLDSPVGMSQDAILGCVHMRMVSEGV